MDKYMTLSPQELDDILADFTDQVKDSNYKKLQYDKWREFGQKFKGKCITLEMFDGDEIEVTSNDKKRMTFFADDCSFGTYLFEEVFGEVVDDWYDMQGMQDFKRRVAESEGTYGVQCTSSNVYPKRNYKVDFASMGESFAKVGEQAQQIKESLCNVTLPVMEFDKVNKNGSIVSADCFNEKEKNMKGFNFDFGPCTNDNIRMSMYGLAIQNNAGVWVSYNNGQVVDVDVMNFDGRQYMFKMPVAVKDIQVGDVVIHNRVPMFVTSTDGAINVVDIRVGEAKTIVPTTNMFGFNFITKIVSMFDAMGNAPTADQPFGNMLPFMLMGEGKDIDPMMLTLMMNGGKGFDMSNPMMLYFLCGKDGKMSDMLPMMMMMNMQTGKHECKCGQHD